MASPGFGPLRDREARWTGHGSTRLPEQNAGLLRGSIRRRDPRGAGVHQEPMASRDSATAGGDQSAWLGTGHAVKAFGPELVRSIKRSFVFTIFHRIFVAHDAQLRRKRNS